MAKNGINTMANLVSRLWSMVSVYIFIPLYIKYLGETTYGLVSFFVTLQMTMNILGLGLSNTLKRELAVGNDSAEALDRKYKLLRSVENIYIVLAAFIFIFCLFASNIIARHWLNIENLDSHVVSNVIKLMGASIALQFTANIYSGCLFGLNHQILVNGINVIWAIAKSLGSLCIIIWVAPNLEYFYSWHILTDIVYILVLRFSVAAKLDSQKRKPWRLKDFSNMAEIWRYTLGILIISLVALVNRQLDKIIISKYLIITELGAYNVSTTLGSLTAIVPAAIYTAIFPVFTRKATTDDTTLVTDFLNVNKIVSIIIASSAAFIAVFSPSLLNIWTGSARYSSILGIVSSLVVLGVAIVEFQEIPYALALAHGNTRLNVIIGLIFTPIVAVLLWIGIKYYGLLGAGIVFPTVMLFQTVSFLFLVYKKYLRQFNPFVLLLKDFIFVGVISLAAAVFSRYIADRVFSYDLYKSLFAVLCGLATMVFEMFFFLKNDFMKYFLKRS